MITCPRCPGTGCVLCQQCGWRGEIPEMVATLWLLQQHEFMPYPEFNDNNKSDVRYHRLIAFTEQHKWRPR